MPFFLWLRFLTAQQLSCCTAGILGTQAATRPRVSIDRAAAPEHRRRSSPRS